VASSLASSSLHINCIDFEKAFDSIGREVLWQLLPHYGMPVKVATIIRALYEGFFCPGGTQWPEDPTTEYEDWGKTRLSAISYTVSGCPGLGDEDSFRQEERYSVGLYDILRGP